MDATAGLRRYLAEAFDTVRWKLDGLPEHELRRPLVATGSNLLGIAKHVALVSGEYFGVVLDRPSALPVLPEDEPNVDMWARAEEPATYIVGLLATAAAQADAALAELPLDAPGRVPWWGEPEVTLHQVAVHVLAEVNRHAGQMDILREMVDGSTGLRPGWANLPDRDEAWWADYRARLETLAESFRPTGGEAPSGPRE